VTRPPFAAGDRVLTDFIPETRGVAYEVAVCQPSRSTRSGWEVVADVVRPVPNVPRPIHCLAGVDADHFRLVTEKEKRPHPLPGSDRLSTATP
jgi:hypothetical protein